MDDDGRFVEVDYREVSPEALRALIEEFITREGTDYGLVEKTLGQKVRDVARQLESGEARLTFDLVEERANIVPRE